MRQRPFTTLLARVGLLSLGLLAGLCATAAPHGYDVPDPTAQLRPAPAGKETGIAAAQAQCQTCHSVDYIAMQPPGKGQAFWVSEVTKMVKFYGAPIDETDAKAIADYLAAAY